VPPSLTVNAALAVLSASFGSIAEDSTSAENVRLPVVVACAVKARLRVSPIASAAGSQETRFAPALHASVVSMAPTVNPAGTSIDRRASAASPGPAFEIVTVSRVSSPGARLAGVAAMLAARSATGSVTICTEAALLPGEPSLAAYT